jgi:hypothetical protein
MSLKPGICIVLSKQVTQRYLYLTYTVIGKTPLSNEKKYTYIYNNKFKNLFQTFGPVNSNFHFKDCITNVNMPFILVCKATFHQGADCFHANSRGKQCVANCAVFVVQLRMKKESLNAWTSVDLNTILCCGDYLYKEIYKTFTR